MATQRRTTEPAIQWDKLRELVAFLRGEPHPDVSKDQLAVFAEVSRLGITRTDFREIDERPGHWVYGSGSYGEWFYRLRRWRNNDPTFRTWWDGARP